MQKTIDKIMKNSGRMKRKPPFPAKIRKIILGNNDESDELWFTAKNNDNYVIFFEGVIPKITELMRNEHKNHRIITIWGNSGYDCYPLPSEQDVLKFINNNLSGLEIYSQDGAYVN